MGVEKKILRRLEDLTLGRNLWQYWTRDEGVEEDNFG